MPISTSTVRAAALLGLAVMAALPSGCRLYSADREQGPLPGPAGPSLTDSPRPPAPGEARRVGGDSDIAITSRDGNFFAPRVRITTPLPEGYPAPTPPGAIELKTYPSVRLAEVHATGNPDRGMNRAFWSLLDHIKRNDIAMTAPVEMTFDQPRTARTTGTPWSMAFLYRTPDLNDTGQDGGITVRDSAPVTVIAVGLRGDYSMSLVQRGMTQLEDWLAQNPGYRPDGAWRVLYYNGPALAWWNKWAEVQLPVRPAGDRP